MTRLRQETSSMTKRKLSAGSFKLCSRSRCLKKRARCFGYPILNLFYVPGLSVNAKKSGDCLKLDKIICVKEKLSIFDIK